MMAGVIVWCHRGHMDNSDSYAESRHESYYSVIADDARNKQLYDSL